MSKIKILPESVYSKIAAGEVIERPASIVRELLDNAIDASATQIKINVEGGGSKRISVIDNGIGIEKEDLELALSKHTTSKIDSIDDLLHITTMGFRGEALYSIQTVSKLTISSNTDSSGEKPGYKISNFGKSKDKVISIAHKKGTRVDIEDIFYNTPARKKFLKSYASELNNIKKAVLSKAFGNLDVGFKLYNGNIPIFFTDGNSDFEKAFFAVYKNENAFPIYKHKKTINEKLRILVYYSTPDVFFSNRRYEVLYVNKRPVSASFFYTAVDSGIRNYISPGRHPLVFVYIDIDPALIDVNIHPAKKEVKFVNQNEVFSGIQVTISEAMSCILKRELYTSNNKYTVSKDNSQLELQQFESERNKRSQDYFNETILSYNKPQIKKESDKLEREGYNILGVVFETYIVVQKKEKIVFIDQHAACERIIYNRKRDLHLINKASEQLLIPIIIDIESWDKENEEKITLLNENGFDIERGEGETIVIREAPSILLDQNDYDQSIELIKSYIEGIKKYNNDSIIDEFLIEASCKEAVKKGDKLTLLEIAEIVEEYFKLDESNCPHGRPIHFELTEDYLEKIFQRKK